MVPTRTVFTLTRPLPDLGATGVLGKQIAAGLESGTAVALIGDLGAGKTTLARAILSALGVDDSVPSPSFSLIQAYDTPRLPVSHIDLFRIEDASELDELGLDEVLDSGAALIEWPELAARYLPADTLEIRLEAPSQAPRLAHMRGPLRWAKIFGTE